LGLPDAEMVAANYARCVISGILTLFAAPMAIAHQSAHESLLRRLHSYLAAKAGKFITVTVYKNKFPILQVFQVPVFAHPNPVFRDTDE
jgi:hypothetical protein